MEEGKTTTVIGIAIALSDAGHRVVVVDADLRQADLSNQLELADTDGLTEVLLEESEVDDVVHPIGLPRIDAISSGRASGRPSELLTPATAATLTVCSGSAMSSSYSTPPRCLLSPTPPLSPTTPTASSWSLVTPTSNPVTSNRLSPACRRQRPRFLAPSSPLRQHPNHAGEASRRAAKARNVRRDRAVPR